MYDHNDIDKLIAKLASKFDNLEQAVLVMIADKLAKSDVGSYDKTNIMKWQLEQLSKTPQVVQEVTEQVQDGSTQAVDDVVAMLKLNVQDTLSGFNKLMSNQGYSYVPMVDNLDEVTRSYVNTAHNDLNNVVRETLLNRNSPNNAVNKIWRDVISKSTLEVATGLKTPDKALQDNMYRWSLSGIPSGLKDKAGKQWRLSTYARMVIATNSHGTFNDLRMKRMKDYGIGQCYMSSHLASRRACSFIQGHVVNVVPSESPDFNDKYDSIYNHGYGTKGGTQGINCKHTLTPFDPDANTVPDEDVPTPEEAEKYADLQAKQRSMERAIRNSKAKLATAKALGDDSGEANAKDLIRRQQAKIRQFVADNDSLHRDYTRERNMQ